jgi:hypothetical protein
MPSRNKEAFEWIKKARELWPPDINKILECYKKAEEISPDYYLIYKDKARLFHGLERFGEAVANYDLEIKKQRERYKNTEMEKSETESEREEFEQGQIVMEEMFGRMKQVRDKAAQKIETEVVYPWEEQIMYFFFKDPRDVMKKELGDIESEFDKIFENLIVMIIQNAGKNCLEKIGHARKYYHALAANHNTLLNEMMVEVFEELKPVMEKTLEVSTHDTNFEKGLDVLDKKFAGTERRLDNPKVKEEIQKFTIKQTEKWLVNNSEEFVLVAQNLMKKKLLKTDHKN